MPLSARTQAAYVELARWLAQRHAADGLKVLGINGSQGSGKSTLAAFLTKHLPTAHGLHAIAVSLDDFYLGQAARAQLAANVHPLLATRGVPGTHDVARGQDCLRLLRTGKVCALPAFSKAADDVLGAEHERIVSRPPDLILFEGWCVGTPPQDAAALELPVNELERSEDARGAWRNYVNAQLAAPYANWFAELDALVYLKVPGWEQVREWRTRQEHDTPGQKSFLADAGAMERFLQHYQRLTFHAAGVLPQSAEVVLRLSPEHDVVEARYS